jgi:dephospho-CoA kinase
MTQRTWRIGLTGGIGSGKSTVAGFLARRGAAIIDADAISRSLTASGGRAMAAIARNFGDDMLSPDGAMAEQAQAAVQNGHRVLVFDVPLLVESGERWRKQVDRVIVVDCDTETQKQRVLARSGLASEEVERIMAQQASRSQRLACADTVLFNQGLSFDDLDAQVARVAADFGL